MKTAKVAVGVVFLFLAGCSSLQTSPSPEPSSSGSSTLPSRSDSEVKVLLNPQSDEACIAVIVNPTVRATGDKKGEVQITIINLLDEEVFIEVTEFDSLSFYFSYRSVDGKAFASLSGGGAFTAFPDNTRLLKRLHTTVVDDKGKRFTCACARAHIRGKLGDARTDLKDCIHRPGAKTTVSIPVTGYLRNSGRVFSEYIRVTIEITDRPETIDGGDDDDKRKE